MKIADNSVALIHFELSDSNGDLIEKTDNEPMAYLHGHHNLIPGLEKALNGKQAGDEFTITIESEEAYGPVQENLIQDNVPKAMFQGVDNLEVGMRFEAQSAEGFHSVVITDVQENTVTVDGNHEFAGKDLTFAIQVVEVREASAEELEHGHAHGVGGHHH
ncbi:FKBP-type peptidyl-prolyl cis-trans isomerase [Thiomicrorhabdus sediminis]|uniref:Peptidyl-prolyl cis-trans isomerase n=1 Tax=Thiomicrorhabdus sediminis TaxID=2580412 RepID=A0A4P9K6X1_9GAMM|nr:peptidylprolyl isomerase [Thiomicrorhabdus sediminis]QCU90076.1 peptidylprolyl isomerase [Thiomicrorhabdus sediminis]